MTYSANDSGMFAEVTCESYVDGTSFISYRSALKLQCYAVRHYTAVARLNQTRSILSLSTTGSYRHTLNLGTVTPYQFYLRLKSINLIWKLGTTSGFSEGIFVRRRRSPMFDSALNFS